MFRSSQNGANLLDAAADAFISHTLFPLQVEVVRAPRCQAQGGPGCHSGNNTGWLTAVSSVPQRPLPVASCPPTPETGLCGESAH